MFFFIVGENIQLMDIELTLVEMIEVNIYSGGGKVFTQVKAMPLHATHHVGINAIGEQRKLHGREVLVSERLINPQIYNGLHEQAYICAVQTRLDRFDNAWYQPGAGPVKRLLWYVVNALIFKSSWFLPMGPKRSILRWFGAKIGQGVVLKPCINIKYPWRLEVGDYTWIGENVWIDNLGDVKIGRHCCLSQGALLLCGNHDFTKEGFDLMVGNITLEDGAWAGAMTLVGPGVSMGSHSVLSAGSVATRNLEPYTIYRGNPAAPVKKREIKG
jgi:putative colanic acid biosynthesis acetyltransferase WcaF